MHQTMYIAEWNTNLKDIIAETDYEENIFAD